MFVILVYAVLIISISAHDANQTVIYIHEELPPNTLIISSIVSTSNNLQWLPSSYPFQEYFYLNENKSLYTTNRTINREEFCEKKYCNCVKCLIDLHFLPIFPTQNMSIRTVHIGIKDINDHSPMFRKSSLQLSIAENLPIDYEIPLESAMDHDYGLLSVQNYALYPTQNNPFELVTRIKPILKLIRQLDRETKSHYLLKLIAYDGGQPSLSGEQNIEIIVTDVNDNAPMFDTMIYRKTLPESQLVDSMIFEIHTIDADEGVNALVSYSIDDSTSTFSINSQTGEIYLKKSLNYEKQRSYSIAIKARDHGVPQLMNYATLIIDVTDVNDHVPNVLLTEVNGVIMNGHHINLSECVSKDVPLLYIHISDEDSGDNGRVTCTLNDTRLSLILLTTNAYSLQISDLSSFDYEIEKFVVVHLQCVDYGLPKLSTSILLHITIDNCNDNPPNIETSLESNQPILIQYEQIEIPYTIAQLTIQDRDYLPFEKFSFTLTSSSPSLDLNITDNGTLILCSMPSIGELFTINVTVYDRDNLTDTLSIQMKIYSMNETMFLNTFRTADTTLILLLIFFIILFLAAILISSCFVVAYLIRTKSSKLQRDSTRNSSCESTNSSNERAGSSQKTIMEVIDEAANSSNRIYQYGVKQAAAADTKVINTSGFHQRDFDYSEKVERYLTHLNNRVIGIDRDEGVYGSSDISSVYPHQQFTVRPLSVSSIQSSQAACQDSLRRFEQLYSIVERRERTNLNTSGFSSDSLYV